MIRIDDRKGSGEEFETLLTNIGVPSYIRRMPFGDFSFKSVAGYGPQGQNIRVGVERKTTDEILQALMDKRERLVDHQLPGLIATYPHHRFLLVEGLLMVEKETGFLVQRWDKTTRKPVYAGFGRRQYRFDVVERYLFTLQMLGGLYLLTTRNKHETAYMLRALRGWYQKDPDEHRSHLMMDKATGPERTMLNLFQPDPSILEARTVKRRIANQLPAVSWKRSGMADKHFKSVVEMVTAPVSEWNLALGIEKGTKLATAIREACFRRDEE